MNRTFAIAILLSIFCGSLTHAGANVKEAALPVKAVRAFEDLIFDRPIVVTHANDGSDRIFVAEQEGIVKVFEKDPDAEEADVFLDIDKRCRYRNNQNEEGLLGFAIHPKFKDNGFVYVYYTTASEDHTSFISRFTSEDRKTADPESEKVLMKIPQPFWNHNGGTIVFGPDGMLYVGLGDGGSGNDPNGNGQNLTTLLGAILRIDVDSPDAGKGYGVPKDNPFIGREVQVNRRRKAAARPEIYAYGLRNVWRMSFDKEDGKLWVADVGQNLWEEINIVEKGGNYGWNIREAKHWFRPDGNDTKSDELIDPVWEYHHDVGKSITGGLVYRGTSIPDLVGKYVYADYVSGRIWALEHNGQQTVANYTLTGPAGDTQPVMSFGDDEDGEIYFTTTFGQLWTFAAE